MNINLHEPYHISERGSDVAHNEITRLLTLARYHVVGHHISLGSVDAEGESHVLLADASSAMRQLDKLSHLTLVLMRLPSIEVALLRAYQGDGAAYSASLGQEVLIHLVRNL